MKTWIVTCLAVLAIACGGKGGDNNDSTDGDASIGDGDGGVGMDAPFGGACTPNVGAPQCSNCIDDDGDGKIDGFDIQCTGPLDNNEGSFSTGIPGDNIDAVDQDCFFDGNSGAGNDGCSIHVCCLLGAPDKASCPIGANRYQVSECPAPLGQGTLSQKCIDTCGKLAPPGCDCFGCCTLCDPANPSSCFDIALNPSTSPNCTTETLADPTKCLRCTKNTMCGNGTCGGASCILCPGQTEADLPPECNMQQCPTGQALCSGIDNSCAAGTYCSNGCCIGTIL
ncbi:MAG: hypothetical protein M3680_20440 [Myxococcota bacterium]|nr:hypothetical protein [Myxococcota bacterium]